MAGMNKLSTADRVRIVACLVEGNSIRSTCRITGFAKGTVLKLLADMGEACKAYHDATVRGLHCQRIQCDEIWSFCYAKDKNLPDSMRDKPGIGSVWTWTALDADTKLMVAYHVGSRDAACGLDFMLDVADRVVNRIQLTTDGHAAYLIAVPEAFGNMINYAQLIKIYGETRDSEARYSPCECIGVKSKAIIGLPDHRYASTSYVERSNLTIRMSQRRFTRLTNAFSKKLANLRHAVALHMAYYNFCRKHQTLGTTPAMQAGLEGHVWTIEELVGLLEEREAQAVAAGALKRGPYRKGNSN